jgi:15-cis-phytoene synthase
LAFQLANISRDIEEDHAAGRCYLPQEWLHEFGIPPGDYMRPEYRPQLAAIAKRMCDSAERYEASAKVGAAKLPFRCRWAVLSAAGIYGDIAREVRALATHAWDQRVYTSKQDKLAWVGKAGKLALSNSPTPVSRDGLWSRPR